MQVSCDQSRVHVVNLRATVEKITLRGVFKVTSKGDKEVKRLQ